MLRSTRRLYSHSSSYRGVKNLKTRLTELIPEKKEELLNIKSKFNNVKVGDITIGSIIGGMRNNSSMFWQSTTLDPETGIRFHGRTIEDCQKLLPKVKDGSKSNSFLPESMLWLLMTSEIPTQDEANSLSKELALRAKSLPQETIKLLSDLPQDLHPMTQLVIGLASLNKYSSFSNKYASGQLGKENYWDSTYEDAMNLIAYLPEITGRIYSKITGNGGELLGVLNEDKDWSYNICSMLGMVNSTDSSNRCNLTKSQSDDFIDLMRLYTGIHVDHEGGNVSAHATHLVGSALNDPFLSYSSGILGLAGPLHGLAAQEVVRFLIQMNSEITSIDDDQQIKDRLKNLLDSRKVIPGYGHAILRKPDPRFNVMLDFVEKRKFTEFKDDDNIKLMQKLSTFAPQVLLEHGKTKNPYPNVDSASGIIFYHYGLKELLFFTVIFGCSRSMGPLTQLVWDRIYGLPIERPKSVDIAQLKALCKVN
ncbi:hypothetical protein TPHA_0P00500 [Tetrapisispora phaffii CBS 4417]|uniref:Citrate synthase n=1 Tax=Tetrapisispora phaffii (strain ATCC 24235 / CBS 4417 / NBRC 1672 / NRRL Y-8282 / UCD 70-5) TaxID=1071381 RepID=G8C230_TETPH|nr:hypothetical protein TPHA_0P00500 [Tetrapisispora phaffii CBS 4417]CCE66208.1 hypothetical protein TPHA_0P00500 [Tetrapisispora phaffii CBS 4417]